MRKVIISGMLGNGLEWYDYALYAYMTLIFRDQFFPAGNADLHLLATLGIFATGFVARPFGALFFGYLGDTFGRRSALAASIFLMAVPTFCIGLLPNYAAIGIMAPLLLILIRVLQGLSLGGAFSGSMAYLVEHAPMERRGLIGSASLASMALGFLLGSMVAYGIKLGLSDDAFQRFGWRIPFLLGLAVGGIGFYIRHHCEESPVYEAAKAEGALAEAPVKDAFAHHWPQMLQATGIYILVTMPFYLLSAYFITFTEHTLKLSYDAALLMNTLNMAILFFMTPASAWLSDRVGRKRVLIACSAAFLLFSYPIFRAMGLPGVAPVMLAQAAFALLVGAYMGPVPALLVEIFPTRVRYTGMALSYNFAAAAFGGTAPMICEFLVQKTGSFTSIVLYVMLCAAIALTALFFYRERYREAL